MDNLSILKNYSPLEKAAIEAASQRDNDQGLQRHSSVFPVSTPGTELRL